MIYLDYASTTPIRQEVLQAYEKILKTYYANADSLHQAGRKVQSLLETSRANIAQLFHVQPREIMFTSCASEANNYALKGFAFANQQRGRHIITSCAEHSSIMSSAAQLQEVFGFEVTYLPLHADGTVHLEEVKKALRKDTILVSIMCVNNETGCINDIRTIANYVHAHSRAMVHSDLVQALGKMELDLSFLDMATFSAHKIFGLKGSGLLYHRANVELLPLISAGQQEDGLRGGTSNAPTEIVFAKTLRLALEEQAAHIAHVRKINDYARSQLAQIPEIDINSPQEALPFILNFSCLCIGSEIMLNALDAKGFCVSAQSTCNSKGKAISHVLLAMGKDELHATHAVRLSFSHLTTMAQIDAFIQSLKEIIKDYATR